MHKGMSWRSNTMLLVLGEGKVHTTLLGDEQWVKGHGYSSNGAPERQHQLGQTHCCCKLQVLGRAAGLAISPPIRLSLCTPCHLNLCVQNALVDLRNLIFRQDWLKAAVFSLRADTKDKSMRDIRSKDVWCRRARSAVAVVAVVALLVRVTC